MAAENETKPAADKVIFLAVIIFLPFLSSFKIDVAIRQLYE